MKTIREHLESIADTELREAALRNMEDGRFPLDKISNAISLGFSWMNTPEGYYFWQEVYFEYQKGGEPTYQQFKHLIR